MDLEFYVRVRTCEKRVWKTALRGKNFTFSIQLLANDLP